MSSNAFKLMTNTITGTPWWAWPLLQYLLWIGLKATHTRVISLPKLFIIPIMLIALKYKYFFSAYSFAPYLAFICIGFGIGLTLGYKTLIKVFKNSKSIELPGNYSTLFILLSFFLIKYIFGYLEATNPLLASEYYTSGLSISALFSGYFLGRAISYLHRFYQK